MGRGDCEFVCGATENSRAVCGERVNGERRAGVTLRTLCLSLAHVDEPQNSGRVTMIFSLFSSNSRPILSTIFSAKACRGGRPHSTCTTRLHAPHFCVYQPHKNVSFTILTRSVIKATITVIFYHLMNRRNKIVFKN